MSGKVIKLEAKKAVSLVGVNCLITGGLGFIGSNLARRLLQLGANVTVVDSMIPQYGGNLRNISEFESQLKINFSDIRDEFATKYLIRDSNIIFNLAGQTSHIDSMTNPFEDLDINARAQLSLLESCRTFNPGVRIVFASTRQIYGRPQYLPVDEKHPLVPVDVNGINKIAAENYHLLYEKVYGIKVTALRLTNTYGPGMRVKDDRQTFLGTWIKSAVEKERFDIFGHGEQKRDFNFVDDVVEAFLLAATNPAAVGRVFNLGSQEVTSLKELARILVDFSPGAGWDLIPFPRERKAIDIGDYYSDFSLVTDTIGWEPRINLQEGLERTMDYYRENHEFYW